MKKFQKEKIVIDFGGKFDKTKAVSPDILKLSDHKYYMYYVGTNCLPHERKGYRLLVAESHDGINFVKLPKPIFNISNVDHKHYSPKVLKIKNNKYRLYYALGADRKYIIKSAVSQIPTKFKLEKGVRIDTNNIHLSAVHTPKLFFSNGKIHCYYTGSDDNGKIYSKKYPQYEFANDFNLYYSTSSDGLNFTKGIKISIKLTDHINFYGHNVYLDGKKVYLIFTGFDGSINRLYITYSQDKINFVKPKVILEPDEKQNELGIYSCTILPLSGNRLRIFYGVRYFDNHWRIHSGIL